jgi:hypothetical protein
VEQPKSKNKELEAGTTYNPNKRSWRRGQSKFKLKEMEPMAAILQNKEVRSCKNKTFLD